MADTVAIGLRALAFAAALQAAGIPIFLWLFGEALDRSARPIRALAVLSATAGGLLTLLHAAVEPARLTGELRGIFDASLQTLLLASDFGTAVGVRAFGLGMIIAGSLTRSRSGAALALFGASLVAVSFAFMGHTAAHDQRWLLAPLLIVHIATIAFWLGSLWPLRLSTRDENPEVGGAIIEQFSRVAIWLVPLILAAGLAMAGLLLPGLSGLGTPYGISLLAKIAGFAVLLGLAAANKWRFGPGVARGERRSLVAFQRSVLAEWCLIVAVVTVTAAMTALFSPEP